MLATLALLIPLAFDGPADNQAAQVRRIPKPGIAVPDDQRDSLQQGLDALAESIGRIDPASSLAPLLPDVQIFHKAVNDALKYEEFFEEKELAKAAELLTEGSARAEALAKGDAPWTRETGLIVRGYTSKIDGSVQPYGLVVPETWQPGSGRRHRLDLWFHGRGETLSEVNFLDERRKRRGEFAPPDAFVLHPYGRYCNAFKFAGEIDVLEALESAKRNYPIDDDRIAVRGFSMGGAAAWQFATHYSDRFFAANPGAGFSETPRFLDVFQREKLEPSEFERTLWNLYDCDKWAANLLQLPTVAYSGERDKQKQAADVMAEALRPLGVELTHIIGPDTEHRYHPDAAVEVERRMVELALRGRDRDSRELTLVTYTLRYNQMQWLTIDGLEQHWNRAEVKARVEGPLIRLDATNVTSLTVDFPPGSPLTPRSGPMSASIDGTTMEGPLVGSDRSWRMSFHKEGGTWRGGSPPSNTPRKRHGLQGPVDDAFMDSFVFVLPTGQGAHPRVNEWVQAESQRAIEHWRRHFRGEARVKRDVDVTPEDAASANLILWGDPSSNAYLREVAPRLPIAWSTDSIGVADVAFPADGHVLILIAPNPFSPGRYVVLNSGFTFREYDYLNNARQVPKLPDWAVVDLSTPPDSRRPGTIPLAGFFDEHWRVR